MCLWRNSPKAATCPIGMVQTYTAVHGTLNIPNKIRYFDRLGGGTPYMLAHQPIHQHAKYVQPRTLLARAYCTAGNWHHVTIDKSQSRGMDMHFMLGKANHKLKRDCSRANIHGFCWHDSPGIFWSTGRVKPRIMPIAMDVPMATAAALCPSSIRSKTVSLSWKSLVTASASLRSKLTDCCSSSSILSALPLAII